MKQQANPYRTSPDVNKQAVGRVSEEASYSPYGTVRADLMAMLSFMECVLKSPSVGPPYPATTSGRISTAKICQSPDGNALFQLMCPKVSRPTVRSDPDGNALFHLTYLQERDFFCLSVNPTLSDGNCIAIR